MVHVKEYVLLCSVCENERAHGYYSSHCNEEWHLASIALFFCIISVPVELKLLHPLDKEGERGRSHDLNDTGFKSYVHNSKG